MRFMCLVHHDGTPVDEMPPLKQQDLIRRSLAYDDELDRAGHFVIATAIKDQSSAVLVRKRDGKLSVTDGPYIETKEQMAGFILIDAKDMAEAETLAAGISWAETGTIEVRPVFVFATERAEA
jgi:hypothetical protein